jgi:hypothetical protein
MIGIIWEIIRFIPKLAKIFKKKKPKRKKLKCVWLLLAALVGAAVAALAICFVPSILKSDGKGGCDAYGHLSHLKIRKEPNLKGKIKTKIKYSPLDLDRYAGEEA